LAVLFYKLFPVFYPITLLLNLLDPGIKPRSMILYTLWFILWWHFLFKIQTFQKGNKHRE